MLKHSKPLKLFAVQHPYQFRVIAFAALQFFDANRGVLEFQCGATGSKYICTVLMAINFIPKAYFPVRGWEGPFPVAVPGRFTKRSQELLVMNSYFHAIFFVVAQNYTNRFSIQNFDKKVRLLGEYLHSVINSYLHEKFKSCLAC